MTFERIEIPQSVIDAVNQKMADEAGMTVPEYLASMKRHIKKNWCSCEEQGDPIFHNDGETPWKSCERKHHYHCSKCKKLTQVG